MNLRHLSCLSLLCCLGCMIPTYQQPQGFSSTYYHELQQFVTQQQQQPQLAADPKTETAASETASAEKKLSDAARIGGPKDQVPKPIELAEIPSELTEEEPPQAAESKGSWWSWIRRPLTFRSSKAEEPNEDELENDADDLDEEPMPPEPQ